MRSRKGSNTISELYFGRKYHVMPGERAGLKDYHAATRVHALFSQTICSQIWIHERLEDFINSLDVDKQQFVNREANDSTRYRYKRHVFRPGKTTIPDLPSINTLHLTPSEPSRLAAKARDWTDRILLDRPILADETSSRRRNQTLFLATSPYGSSAVHGTMFSLGWFAEGISRENDEPDASALANAKGCSSFNCLWSFNHVP